MRNLMIAAVLLVGCADISDTTDEEITTDTAEYAVDSDPTIPLGTYSEARCAELSDTYWHAIYQAWTPCLRRGCTSAFWLLIARNALDEWKRGNCSYWGNI